MWDLAHLCNHAYQVVIKQPVSCSDYTVEQDQILYALRTTIKLNVYRSRGCLAYENCYSDGKRIGGLQRSDLEDGTGTALQQLQAQSTGPFFGTILLRKSVRTWSASFKVIAIVLLK